MTPPDPVKSAPLAPPREASMADIRQFVQQQKAAPVGQPEVTKGAEEFAVPPELEQYLAHKKEAVQDERFPLPEIPPEPAADPTHTGQQELLNQSLGVSALVPEITQEEKDIFCKATLFDQPVVFDIQVLGGRAIVKVRTLSILHSDVIAWWLLHLETQKKITTMTMWGIMAQRANVALRAVSMRQPDGTEKVLQDCMRTAHALEAAVAACRPDYQRELGHGVSLDYPETPPEARQAAVQAMDQHVTAMFRTLSPGTFGLLQQAAAVHEQKFNYLTRQAASGNFWLPAATA